MLRLSTTKIHSALSSIFIVRAMCSTNSGSVRLASKVGDTNCTMGPENWTRKIRWNFPGSEREGTMAGKRKSHSVSFKSKVAIAAWREQ